MERIRVVGCAAVMVCMAVSVCFAADSIPWFAGDTTSIGQGVPGFASVKTALAGDLSGFSGTTVESAMQLLSGGTAISKLGGIGASGNLLGSSGIQTTLSGISAEPSLIGTEYNPIQRADGTSEESRNALWALIKPWYEKGVAAMTPQQPLAEFLADVKAGKVSQAEAQNYMTQLQANIDAFKAALQAAANEWIARYNTPPGEGPVPLHKDPVDPLDGPVPLHKDPVDPLDGPVPLHKDPVDPLDGPVPLHKDQGFQGYSE